jgi:hypothetical protein
MGEDIMRATGPRQANEPGHYYCQRAKEANQETGKTTNPHGSIWSIFQSSPGQRGFIEYNEAVGGQVRCFVTLANCGNAKCPTPGDDYRCPN